MPRSFLEAIVRPNLKELQARDNDMRAAVNALLTIDALAGAIFYAARPSLSDRDDTAYRERLARQAPYFELLRDAAKALKHGELVRGNPVIRRAADAQIRAIGWDEAYWDEIQFDAEPQVVIAVQSGGYRVARIVAENALTVLEDEMTRLGL